MRRQGHLFEKVVGFCELCAAARRAAKGTRSRESLRFLFELEPEVLRLQRELLEGTYRPGPYRVFHVADPKPRRICAAPFRDRVAHHALCAALEPVFERYAIDDSYACRKGKGVLAAVRRAQALARRHGWFVKLDVARYFESASHSVLLGALARQVKDRRVLELVEVFVRAGAPGSPPGRGLPIGNLTSQHFANFYLGALDHHALQVAGARGYARFMDDTVAFGRDRQEVQRLRDELTAFIEGPLELRVKESATVVDRVSAGVPFLGMRVWPRLVRLDGHRVRRWRRRMRDAERTVAATPEAEDEVALSAQSVVAWVAQADTSRLRSSFFQSEAGRRGPQG